MNRTILTLSAASVAALSLFPGHLFASSEAGGEHWAGYININGEKTPIHLQFEAGAGDVIRGRIISDLEGSHPLENVAIVGNTLYFNIKDLPGNPTFKGTISDDGLSVSGTYSLHGDHHTFEVAYLDTPPAGKEPPVSNPSAPAEVPGGAVEAPSPVVVDEPLPERWNGSIKAPSGDLGVELAFRENPDGTISGTISIPEQSVRNHALSTFTISGFDVSFGIPGIPGDPKFIGRIAEHGRTIAGDFVQAGQRVPFTLAWLDSGANVNEATPAPSAETSLLSAPAASSAPVITSDKWKGTVELPGERLEVEIDFFAHADEIITGDITVASQNSFDLPLTSVSIFGNDVSFGIAEVEGDPRFSGTIAPDGSTLSGTFSHHGSTFPFSLSYTKPG